MLDEDCYFNNLNKTHVLVICKRRKNTNYFDLSINGKKIGKIVTENYSDVTNFIIESFYLFEYLPEDTTKVTLAIDQFSSPIVILRNKNFIINKDTIIYSGGGS